MAATMTVTMIVSLMMVIVILNSDGDGGNICRLRQGSTLAPLSKHKTRIPYKYLSMTPK